MKHIEEMYASSPMAELVSEDGAERLRIYTYGYEFPEAKNMFDADWQLNHLSLISKGQKVEINGPFLEGNLLKKFQADLLALSQRNSEPVEFISTDEQLIVCLTTLDSVITVTGEIYNCRPENGNSTTTEFNFLTNSDSLKKFIKGIEKILMEYPSRLLDYEWR